MQFKKNKIKKMKKFSQLRQVKRINEQEITLPKDGESTQSTVKVEIHSDGTTTNTTTQETKPEEVNNQETKTEETTQEGSGSVVKFFSKIFESREVAHVYHLTVKGEEGSHAKHKALGEYYESIIGMLDDIIEVYQGEYEVIEGYEAIDTSLTKSTDTVKYFEELASFIKVERKKCFKEDDTQYFNIIDDMLVLIYKTLYKLKYNK